jgi:hypothetical protein
VAFQAVQQPPQPQDLLGQGGIGQAIQVLAGHLLDGVGQGGQPVRRPARWPGLRVRMCVRFHGGNLSTHQAEASTKPRSGDNFSNPLSHPPEQVRKVTHRARQLDGPDHS